MKITLLDPGLKGTQGHHFDLDIRLAEALMQRGHEVDIHAYVEPEPTLIEHARARGMTLRPTFRIPTYTRIPFYQPAVKAYSKLIDTTAADIAAIAPSDLWVWPTLAPYQLAAALSKKHAVRQLGGTWWLPKKPVPAGERIWARTAQALAEQHYPITVGAYDPALCLAHQNAFPGLLMPALPCPHDGARPDKPSTAVRRIGFFGQQRNKRGLALMPKLVDALLAQGFEVVVQDSSPNKVNTPARAGLTRLPYVADFAAQIIRCDLVVWPSKKAAYRHSWSGVVSESVASGVPLVVPSGCMPGDLVARYGCGTFFHDFNHNSILAAVAQAVSEFPTLSKNAQAAALDWHARNGTDRLAAWIDTHATQGITP